MSELIEALRETSPQVWEALLKQVYSDAVVALMWGIVFSAYFCFAVQILRSAEKSKPNLEEHEIPRYVVSILIRPLSAFVALISAVICFATYAQMTYNPDYYAIQLIIKSLLK